MSLEAVETETVELATVFREFTEEDDAPTDKIEDRLRLIEEVFELADALDITWENIDFWEEELLLNAVPKDITAPETFLREIILLDEVVEIQRDELVRIVGDAPPKSPRYNPATCLKSDPSEINESGVGKIPWTDLRLFWVSIPMSNSIYKKDN